MVSTWSLRATGLFHPTCSGMTTAQGVRDLNHTGPKKKPQPISAAASEPMVATPDNDKAPPPLESIAGSDQTASGSAVGNE